MPFLNENTAAKVIKNSPFQVGQSDVDPGLVVEGGVGISWASDPIASWVYYDCTVGTMLDSGIVVHNRLPQNNPSIPATLSSCDFANLQMDQLAGVGVNLRCQDQYEDIVQRMGHARYWFRLWGQALRIGYQVPIPSIKTVGGVEAIPYDKNPQWAFNRIAPGGNYSGVIMWHAAWSLWYTTAVPPLNSTIPAADPAAHISGVAPLPQAMQAPFTRPDDSSLPQAISVPPNLPQAVVVQ